MLTLKTEVEDNVTEHTIEMGHSLAYVTVVRGSKVTNAGIRIQVFNGEEEKVLDSTINPVTDANVAKAIKIAFDFLGACEGTH